VLYLFVVKGEEKSVVVRMKSGIPGPVYALGLGIFFAAALRFL